MNWPAVLLYILGAVACLLWARETGAFSSRWGVSAWVAFGCVIWPVAVVSIGLHVLSQHIDGDES